MESGREEGKGKRGWVEGKEPSGHRVSPRGSPGSRACRERKPQVGRNGQEPLPRLAQAMARGYQEPLSRTGKLRQNWKGPIVGGYQAAICMPGSHATCLFLRDPSSMPPPLRHLY